MNILKIFFLLFFIISFISCGKEEKITILKNENIEEQMIELYNEGYTEFLNGDTLYAAKKFNEAELIFPQSEWAPVAALMTAYVYYSDDYYGDAISELERFLKVYPNHKDVDYAHFLLAMCYYENIVDEKRDLAPLIKAKKELLKSTKEDDIFRELGYDIIVEFMKPNLLYDLDITEKRQKESISKVPRSHGVVLENELIVDANMRITEEVLSKLNSLSYAVSIQQERSGFYRLFGSFLGRLILLSVIISLFFAFLVVYRVSIFHDWKMVLLISVIFLLQIVLANIVVIQLGWSEFLIPVTVGAMSLTILFDSRIGFMATTSLAIMIGLMVGQNIDLVIVSLFTATIAVYNIRDLRKRSQLFTTMFALIAASIFVIVGLGLFKGNSWEIILRDVQFLTINSILAPILTYGLIGIFELLFEVTTNLTLIELLDYDHPLLKRAQRETNGTFNHSIVVGNLAEACANSIGAHSLLCRVGAYYHDIGKMEKSQYFIENQFSGDNKHDKITNTMSAKIIRAHVKSGLKLANQYGLPKIVSDFIPMHHGTTRVEYFYRMALKDAEENGGYVEESSFRYPGPKPNTKETGILMLCEAIEAAVRSIKNPDIMKIEAMIDKIIKQRIDDGQLNECPLTLDELNKIKGTVDGNTGMLHVLRGIYHIRIEYPDDK